MKNVLTMPKHHLTYYNRKFDYLEFFKQEDALKNTPSTLNVLQETTYSWITKDDSNSITY